MIGTDLYDMFREQFSCQRKSKKYWHSLMYWMFDSAKNNAYAKALWTWEHVRQNDNKPYMTRKNFYKEIAQHYMGVDFTTIPDVKRLCVQRKKVGADRGYPRREDICFKLDPEKGKARGNCKYCYLTSKRRVDVWSKCKSCGVKLHFECMRPWHVSVMRHYSMMS